MKLPIFIADAFTATAFRGNPAAVCLLENALAEDAHQQIAREMNLSETAFVRKLQPSDNFTQSSHFGLRWFTPESEVPLCGHATLASAAVLFHKIKNTNSTLTFTTMSGELKARRAEDGIVLDFPLYPAFPQDFHEVEDLIKASLCNFGACPGTRSVDKAGLKPEIRQSASLLLGLKVCTTTAWQFCVFEETEVSRLLSCFLGVFTQALRIPLTRLHSWTVFQHNGIPNWVACQLESLQWKPR
ncbi:phenazine biosynthesis-like domain-containing protein 1 isoform X3 [Alexandromys fortis]|uniref:phenazine biosynthesis-like domain-containing protein 1 isoform X3 n=1 Tax=Alexandromys fortis TaxID=100897 RepID=UPI0021539456|nr:phenazine biosynthesis-like domain-containing protein 1 isoform X3 [Microtus fortis]